jgi:hypothetical protein
MQLSTTCRTLNFVRGEHAYLTLCEGTLKPHCIRCCHFKVDDVSALEAISKLLSGYALLKTTPQRHCISSVPHGPGYGLDAVTT